ncbi:hypothetical protein AKJ18_21795 [Vibrio xuii]|nr:hypothetical protein AKJ18_21795 [Vibrio xuii]
MATREKHLQYGKSLGLWQGGQKVIEPDVDRRIERVKAALAERDAEELLKSTGSPHIRKV